MNNEKSGDAPITPPPDARRCTCHPDDRPAAPCRRQYAATDCQATQAGVPNNWRNAVQTAYGFLWMVNKEPGTPNQYAPEKAAYEARKVLRDLLTHDERGDGINAAMLARTPPADRQCDGTIGRCTNECSSPCDPSLQAQPDRAINGDHWYREMTVLSLHAVTIASSKKVTKLEILQAAQAINAHARKRLDPASDAGKTSADWFWTVGYPAGKALIKQMEKDKVEQHIIATATGCLEWQAAMFRNTDVQPASGEDARDAARYRLIRGGEQNVWCSSGDDLLTGSQLDAAIDAIRAQHGGQS